MKNLSMVDVDYRIDYIVNKILKIFNIKKFRWQYYNSTYNAVEGRWNSNGSFLPYMIYKKNFFLKLDFFEKITRSLDPKIKINEKKYYFLIHIDSSNLNNLEMKFPTRWIFDDFEDEFIMGFIIDNL